MKNIPIATTCCDGTYKSGRRCPLVVPRFSPLAGQPAPRQESVTETLQKAHRIERVLLIAALAVLAFLVVAGVR